MAAPVGKNKKQKLRVSCNSVHATRSKDSGRCQNCFLLLFPSRKLSAFKDFRLLCHQGAILGVCVLGKGKGWMIHGGGGHLSALFS